MLNNGNVGWEIREKYTNLGHSIVIIQEHFHAWPLPTLPYVSEASENIIQVCPISPYR